MPKRLFLITALLLILTACDGLYFATPTPSASLEPTVWVTNTAVAPTDEPTPTGELATWTPETPPTATSGPIWWNDCLPDNVAPIAAFCPQHYAQTSLAPDSLQIYPVGMELDIELITNGQTTMPDITFENDHLSIKLNGFGGEVLFEAHGIEMFAGHCYTFNMPAYSNFLAAPFYPTSDNVNAISRLYLDNGTWFNLHSRGLVLGDEPNKTLTGPQDLFWPFQPSTDLTVVWAVGYRSIWAVSGNNHFDIFAWYIQDQVNTELCR